MSWQLEVDEIRRREALAREMGGKDNVEFVFQILGRSRSPRHNHPVPA